MRWFKHVVPDMYSHTALLTSPLGHTARINSHAIQFPPAYPVSTTRAPAAISLGASFRSDAPAGGPLQMDAETPRAAALTTEHQRPAQSRSPPSWRPRR